MTSTRMLKICNGSICSAYPPEKKNDYRNQWNLIKILIIVITSKSGQGKTYAEYEYDLVARWAGCKSKRNGIVYLVWVTTWNLDL